MPTYPNAYAIVAPVRDAVVVALNVAGVLPAGCVAVAIYDEAKTLQDLKTPRVVVKPAGKRQLPGTRGGPQPSEVSIHVAVQYAWPTGTTGLPAANADPYLQLAERLAATKTDGGLFLHDQAGLGGDARTQCVSAGFVKGLFIEEHLLDFRTFTSVVELTFRVAS